MLEAWRLSVGLSVTLVDYDHTVQQKVKICTRHIGWCTGYLHSEAQRDHSILWYRLIRRKISWLWKMWSCALLQHVLRNGAKRYAAWFGNLAVCYDVFDDVYEECITDGCKFDRRCSIFDRIRLNSISTFRLHVFVEVYKFRWTLNGFLTNSGVSIRDKHLSV